jgi:NifU-like protein involved in Fe-S cluster formation
MADDPRYGAEVLRRFRELPGAGDLADDGSSAVASGRADAADEGARVLLRLRVRRGVVVEARFRAYGCPYFIAAASWLTERLTGASREQLAQWDWREAADALEIPPSRFGRLITLQDAARAAAAAWPGEAASAV